MLPSHDILEGCEVALGKVHCCPSHVKANWSCDSVARDILKRAFAKSSTAWCTPRTMAKVPKVGAMLGTATWMGGIILLVSWESMDICHEPSGNTGLLKALWAKPIIPIWCSSWIVLLFPYAPRQFILFDNYHFSHGWYNWHFPSALV